MKSLKGQLLLASPELHDPNFARAVVLLVQHDENGAMGLILDRPMTATVREAMEASLGREFDVQGFLHQGGPCDSPLMLLHADPDQSQIEVIEGVHFTAERPKIESILDNASMPAKFFLGCSGWAPGQLENELEVGSWIVVPANSRRVFDAHLGSWQRVMTETNLAAYVDPNNVPDDPTVN